MIPVAKVGWSVALAIISSCLLPGAAEAADGAERISAAVDEAIGPLMSDYKVPGMAVAVTVRGQRHFFTYGVASKDTKQAVTKDTLFEIGSVSKTFAAMLAAYAQALGKMSLEDHPSKYMPELRGSAIDRASLLNLGTYSAGGLPLQFPKGVTDGGMIRYFQQWKPAAAPGSQRRYSNPSIGLFGHATALAMRGDYADLMEREIFPRLGMQQSYVRVPEAEMGRYAWGYDKANKPSRMTRGVLYAGPYGVKSTAEDMIRYVEANISPEALEPSIERAIEATHIGYFRVGAMVQGLGWEQYPYPVALDRLLDGNSEAMAMEPQPATELTPPLVASAPTLFNKTGSTRGFSAYVAFVPKEEIGIVMLANNNVPIPARIKAAHAVLTALSAEVR